MKKNTVKLTESQLHSVIKECVRKVLYENKFDGKSKTKAYDINSKKYKKMFDKGSAADIEKYMPYTDDIKQSESAEQEFLNRPNAARDFEHFPRFSVNRGNTNYDNLANGSSRINQYKELSKKRKEVGTIKHFENWLKEQDKNGLDEFFHYPSTLQKMVLSRYAHVFNINKREVYDKILGYDNPTSFLTDED